MRWVTVFLVGLFVLVPAGRDASSDEPRVSTLVVTLRHDPSSPAAALILRRLAQTGKTGWRALAALASDPTDPVMQLEATTTLVAGTHPDRTELAARIYKRVDRDDLRTHIAIALAQTYPRHGKLLRAHMHDQRPGALDVLRVVARRGLAREELETLLQREQLAELARELLRGIEPTPPGVLAQLPRARAVALEGLAPQSARLFAETFAKEPDKDLLRALAEVLRENDEQRRTGAHCLLLVTSGMDIAPDAALWHSWIEAQGDTYTPPDPVSRGAVAAAIVRGVGWLKRDLAADGKSRWKGTGAYRTKSRYGTMGVTALAVLALRSAGVAADDPAIQKALDTTLLVRDRRGRPGLRPLPAQYQTYTAAILAMALRAMGPKAFETPLRTLRNRLIAGMFDRGRWGYLLPSSSEERSTKWDNSNIQYANLGLRALRRAGQEIEASTWKDVAAHWRGVRYENDEWGYRVTDKRGPVQMTASGIAGLAIAAEGLHGADAAKRISEDEAIQEGLIAMGGRMMRSSMKYRVYSFYAIERACVLTGVAAFEGGGVTLDWYREGAWRLLNRQSRGGSWGWSYSNTMMSPTKGTDTSMALLFLTKATATIGGTAERIVKVEIAADEAVARAKERAPAPGRGAPIAWRMAKAEDPAAIGLFTTTRHLRTRSGKTQLAGTVSGPVTKVTVAGVDVAVDEAGQFVAEFEVAASGAIEAVATGADGRTETVRIEVEIDDVAPSIELAEGRRVPAARQRIVLEASEPLAGVAVGRHYFPADGDRVTVTADIKTRYPKLAVVAYDLAGNKTRRTFEFDVEDRALDLDGKSALRIDVPAKPPVFTLECWVKMDTATRTAALISDTSGGGAGLFFKSEEGTQPYAVLGPPRRKYVWGASSRQIPRKRWTHVAMTYDGNEMAIWIDGRESGRRTVTRFARSKSPFWIGAASHGSKPGGTMFGMIDEVRISDVVRYAEGFRPAPSHGPDRNTLLLLHFDIDENGKHHDASRYRREVVAHGAPRVVPAKR